MIDPAGGYAYFGTYTSPGIIVRVRLSDFTRVDALTLNTGEDDLFSAVMDPVQGFAYFGTLTSPGIVVKIDLAQPPVRRHKRQRRQRRQLVGECLHQSYIGAGGRDQRKQYLDGGWSLQACLHWAPQPTTNPLDPFASFQLVNGVSIYGGFPPGGGNGTFTARNPGPMSPS